MSDNFLIIKRFGYLYYRNEEGEGVIKVNTEKQRDRAIQEIIGFLYFDLEFLKKKKKMKIIINKLREFDENNNIISNEKIKLNFFKSRFYLLDNLLYLLIQESYVSKKDKIFLIKLLNDSLKRQIKY